MDSDQQYNLRWNNHTNSIFQVFLEHFSSETLVDVTLSCQGQFLRAHKMVLSACSPYFQELFKVHQVQHPVIIMHGIKYNEIKQIVDFMYRGEAKVPEADLNGLLAAAEMLQVKGLSNVRNKYTKGDIFGADAPGLSNREPPPLEPCLPTSTPVTSNPATPTVSVPVSAINAVSQPVLQTQTQPQSAIPALTPTVATPAMTQPLQTTARVLIPVAAVAKRKKSEDAPQKPVETPAKKPNCRTTPESKQLSSTPVQTNNRMDEDELPATIKVEPLDIRDIDEEVPWSPPRLVIDMREETTKKAPSTVKTFTPVRTSLLKVRPAADLVPPSGEDTLKENEPKKEPVDQLVMKTWRGDKRVTRIPRPPNAFMIFANEWRRKLAMENPGDSNKDISVRLGVKWKNLTAEKKAIYYTASRIADEEHKKKYPNYYYSPKEARLRKSQQQIQRRRFALERVNAAAAAEAGKSLSPDPLRFVKVFMKDPSTRGMFVAVDGSNPSIANAPSDVGPDSQADLEEEFLKLVEEGQVEAEVEGELDGLTEPVDEEEVIGQDDIEMEEEYPEDTKPDISQLELEAESSPGVAVPNCALSEEVSVKDDNLEKSEALNE